MECNICRQLGYWQHNNINNGISLQRTKTLQKQEAQLLLGQPAVRCYF